MLFSIKHCIFLILLKTVINLMLLYFSLRQQLTYHIVICVDLCMCVYIYVYIYIYVTLISLNYTSKSEIWGRLFKYSQVPSTHGKNVIKISLKKGNLQSLKKLLLIMNYYFGSFVILCLFYLWERKTQSLWIIS